MGCHTRLKWSGKIGQRAEDNEAEIKELHAMIGKLAVKKDFLSQGLMHYRHGIAQQCPERR